MGKELYDQIGAEMSLRGVVVGQMFGKACLKSTEGKAFAAFQNEFMVFKLGRDWISLNNGKFIGAVNWDPSGKGRPMKDWLAIPSKYAEYWAELAPMALQFVSHP